MSQVTIYLDKETEKKLKSRAKANKLSVSKWITEMIQEKVKSEWSPDVAAMAGSWGDDFPEAAELRKQMGKDIPREEF